MKSALVIRHASHEGLAGYRAPIEAAGYAIETVDVGDPRFGQLDLAHPDLLVLLGGPLGVYERDKHPWIAGELERIARRLAAAPLRHLAGVPVLHWHGDTFDLPAGAELLASTARYPHQAFAFGRHALALQFHAEMGLDPQFHVWTARGTRFIEAAGTSAAQLTADHARHGARVVAAGQAMLAEWLAALDQAGQTTAISGTPSTTTSTESGRPSRQ